MQNAHLKRAERRDVAFSRTRLENLLPNFESFDRSLRVYLAREETAGESDQSIFRVRENGISRVCAFVRFRRAVLQPHADWRIARSKHLLIVVTCSDFDAVAARREQFG